MTDQPAEANAPRPAAAESSASTSTSSRSFGPLFFFCLGALAAKLTGGLLPPFFSSAFDLVVYGGIALGFALAYRRFVRRTIEERRRVRARRADSAGGATRR